MNMDLLVVFVVLNVLNVIIQTVKSLATVKCGKTAAAIVNAIAYGLYTVVLVYTVCDLPLGLKASIVAVANLIGVYVVKWFEEKTRKDRLWKVEATFFHNPEELRRIESECHRVEIPMNWIDIDKYYIINFYCATQEQSAIVKRIVSAYGGKYFVTETKKL